MGNGNTIHAKPAFYLLILLITACNTTTVDVTPGKSVELATAVDTTPGITGIGGIFFAAEDPAGLLEWYGSNLGMVTDPYGAVFEFRNSNRPEEINYLRWSAFKKGSTYLSPSRQEMMINYRVRNIEGMVRNLKAAGVNVLDEIETYDYGKFVHILDPEGNKIELWEPVDEALTALGGKTNR